MSKKRKTGFVKGESLLSDLPADCVCEIASNLTFKSGLISLRSVCSWFARVSRVHAYFYENASEFDASLLENAPFGPFFRLDELCDHISENFIELANGERSFLLHVLITVVDCMSYFPTPPRKAVGFLFYLLFLRMDRQLLQAVSKRMDFWETMDDNIRVFPPRDVFLFFINRWIEEECLMAKIHTFQRYGIKFFYRIHFHPWENSFHEDQRELGEMTKYSWVPKLSGCFTIFHILVWSNQVKVLKHLMQNDECVVYARLFDLFEMTPLDYAKRNSSDALVQILEDGFKRMMIDHEQCEDFVKYLLEDSFKPFSTPNMNNGDVIEDLENENVLGNKEGTIYFSSKWAQNSSLKTVKEEIQKTEKFIRPLSGFPQLEELDDENNNLAHHDWDDLDLKFSTMAQIKEENFDSSKHYKSIESDQFGDVVHEMANLFTASRFMNVSKNAALLLQVAAEEHLSSLFRDTNALGELKQAETLNTSHMQYLQKRWMTGIRTSSRYVTNFAIHDFRSKRGYFLSFLKRTYVGHKFPIREALSLPEEFEMEELIETQKDGEYDFDSKEVILSEDDKYYENQNESDYTDDQFFDGWDDIMVRGLKSYMKGDAGAGFGRVYLEMIREVNYPPCFAEFPFVKRRRGFGFLGHYGILEVKIHKIGKSGRIDVGVTMKKKSDQESALLDGEKDIVVGLVGLRNGGMGVFHSKRDWSKSFFNSVKKGLKLEEGSTVTFDIDRTRKDPIEMFVDGQRIVETFHDGIRKYNPIAIYVKLHEMGQVVSVVYKDRVRAEEE